jgi:hypothetical protein
MKLLKQKSWIYNPITISLIVFFIIISALRIIFIRHNRTFNSAVWQDKNQLETGVRLEMADDLIANDKLHGMTRAGVFKLLGGLTKTNKFSDWDLVYYLGNERSFISIDSEWLVIYFNAEGKVEDYRIVKD